MSKESIFITGNQIPNANEETTQSILDIIKNASTFQDVINTLEKDKLIWYFLRHLLKDQEVLDLINPKWKGEFANFNQSIDSTVKELKGSTENQEFLVYPKSDNSLEMRFIGDDPKQISVETSSVLRASPEGKTINISLGIDSTISAIRKKGDEGDERHYYFSNSDSCKMVIDWQAKDDQGKLINCSMTLRVGPNGVEAVIDEPKFGGITDEKKVIELVRQNTEVFINGKSLYQACTSMTQSVNNQQKAGETILPISAEEKDISRSNSNLSDKNDSGVLTPSLTSSDNEYESDDFENEVKVEEDEHEELEQKSKQSQKDNKELEQENEQLRENNEKLEQKNKQLKQINEEFRQDNTQLKKDHKELKERNERIIEEGDDYRLQLGKSEEKVRLLESELAKKEDELRTVRKENEAEVIKLQTSVIELKGGTEKLEKDLKDRDDEISKLNKKIVDMQEEINLNDKENEELQNQLDASEQERGLLSTENEELKEVHRTLTSALNGQGEELAESQSKLKQLEEELKTQLKDLTDEHESLKDDLEQERKKNQQSNVNVLDEMSGDGKDEEIQNLKEKIQELEATLKSAKEQNELAKKDENKLKKQVKEKNREISKISERLENAKKEIESRESQSQQKIQELSKELQIAQEELEETRDELNKNNELIDQLRDGTVSKESFAKLQSERDKLRNDSTVKEKQLVAINTKLEQAQKEVKDTKEILEVLEDKLRQQEEQKATQHGALPEDNQDMQTTIVQENQTTKELEQENSDLIEENSGLKQSLKNLKEENEQLKQKPVKVNASTTTDKKETKEMGTQTEGEFSHNVFNDKGKYLRTEFKGMPPPKTNLSEPSTDPHIPSTDGQKLP